MEKKWKCVEKGVAGFKILIGGIFLYGTCAGLYLYFGWTNWENISILKLITDFHQSFILSILTLFAGVTLLLGKRIGWITMLAAILMHIINLNWKLINTENTKDGLQDMPEIWVPIMAILIVCFILLLQKSFRSKYLLDPQALWTIGILTTIWIIDTVIA